MTKIRITSSGGNGSIIYHLWDLNTDKCVISGTIPDIIKEIEEKYPEIAKQFTIMINFLSDIEDIDTGNLQPGSIQKFFEGFNKQKV